MCSPRKFRGCVVTRWHGPSLQVESLAAGAGLRQLVSSAYLRLLIFFPAILILACASSSPAFLMMYSAQKLNKHSNSVQPWCTPFSIWNQSVVPCPVLTVASWPPYRFLKRQVKWPGIPISQNFPQFIVIHTVKGFGIVNKAEVVVLLELSCFFNDSMDAGNFISGSSVFSKSSLNYLFR